MPAARPFDPESLADRWGVSATSVRNLCRDGSLQHFRVGRLYRIPAQAVEEYECQTSASDAYAEASASTGGRMESESGVSLRHARERKRSRKL